MARAFARAGVARARCTIPLSPVRSGNPALTLPPHRRVGPRCVRPTLLEREKPRPATPLAERGFVVAERFRHIGRSWFLPLRAGVAGRAGMIEVVVMGLAAVFAAVILLVGAPQAVRGRRG